MQAYIDGELNPAERVVFERHIAECAGCAAELDAHKAVSALLVETLQCARLDHDMTAAVQAHLPEMDPARRIHARSRDASASYTKPNERGRVGIMAWAPALAAVMLAALGIALVLYWPDAPLRTESEIGLITSSQGETFRSDFGAINRGNVTVEASINPGDRFETGDGSALMLGLAGPSHIKVDENSRIRVLGERQMAVESGRVWLDIAKDRRLFHVATPAGDITVFGTRFSVEVRGDAATVVVQEGEVQVENDLTFTRVNPGESVQVAFQRKPLLKEPVDTDKVMAWASAIQPESKALAMLQATIAPQETNILRAKQVFVVRTHKHPVASINIEWEPHTAPGGFASYHLYVSGDRMQPLFKGYIGTDVLGESASGRYELVPPADIDFSGINVLHIDVISDNSTGAVDTPFTGVYAVGL